MIRMTFWRNHCDKTVWLGNMTNVIVTNPDYRLAPVYYYSLFLTLQVIGNLYFYFFSYWVFFFISGIASIGSGVYLFLYFLFLFSTFFYFVCSLGYISFFYFFIVPFFPCKNHNCKLKVEHSTVRYGIWLK